MTMATVMQQGKKEQSSVDPSMCKMSFLFQEWAHVGECCLCVGQVTCIELKTECDRVGFYKLILHNYLHKQWSVLPWCTEPNAIFESLELPEEVPVPWTK